MTDARIGRLLAACLDQAVVEVLPSRADFYQHWLQNEGLRDGAIGLAPLTAVLGFLRAEGEAYNRVMARAGEFAADWSVTSMPAFQRRLVGALPRGLRVRAALRRASAIMRSIYSASRATPEIKGGQIRIHVRGSLFCTTREPQKLPLCGFYASLATRTLALFDIGSTARIEECRAVDCPHCVIALALDDARAAGDRAIAA